MYCYLLVDDRVINEGYFNTLKNSDIDPYVAVATVNGKNVFVSSNPNTIYNNTHLETGLELNIFESETH